MHPAAVHQIQVDKLARTLLSSIRGRPAGLPEAEVLEFAAEVGPAAAQAALDGLLRDRQIVKARVVGPKHTAGQWAYQAWYGGGQRSARYNNPPPVE